MLAQQTSLDQNLTGGDIKTAFQKSGLFLEASLASGSVPPAGGIPDLKAALIVLRQTLQSALGGVGAAAVSATAARRRRCRADAGAVGSPRSSMLQEILLPQARLPVADDLGAAPHAARRAAFSPRRKTGASAAPR